jgi:uncharacterized protein (DUF433 family)
MNDRVLIISDPLVMMGKPVIAGTRITVDFGELVFRLRYRQIQLIYN